MLSVCLLGNKGQSLRYSPGRGNSHHCFVVLYIGEESKREQCHLLSSLWLSVTTHKQIGPFWSWLPGGWVCACSRTLWVSPSNSPVWGWELLLVPQRPQVFSVRGFEALSPCSATLGCMVCLVCQLFLLVYPHANVELPALPAAASPGPPADTLPTSSCCLASNPLHSGYLFPPLLLVWTNVSSLTPWFSDFHTVSFSDSCGYFLFLKCCCWCLSFGCARRQSVSTMPASWP